MYSYFEIDNLKQLNKKQSTSVQVVGYIDRSLKLVSLPPESHNSYVTLDFHKLRTIPSKLIYVHAFGDLICDSNKTYLILDFYNELNDKTEAIMRQQHLNKLHNKLLDIKYFCNRC